MPNGQATGKAEGRSKLTPEQWEHIRANHITILINKEKNLIEIGWVSDCGENTCQIRHERVCFYSCPRKPCPPITI
jgi:hypothetical protein